ncbi:MAG: metallophosphoesterase family protein [Bifidobacteriaceae bacterium]|nr:metallophosphoesterase family protein [Bifidobacteriaceae bacterium]
MSFKLGVAAGTVAAAGALGVAYAAAEAHWYTLRRVTVPVLPAGAAPLKVLHLSDLHLTARQHRKVAFVRALAGLEPDLVVSTGDFISSPEAAALARDATEPLTFRPGAFVFGSNDYYSAHPGNPFLYLLGKKQPVKRQRDLPYEALRQVWTSAGWLDLNNARARLHVGGLAIDLVGVDDPHLGLDRFPTEGAGQHAGADLVVGVAHAPYMGVVQAMVDDGARLVLAGHTHGGQLCLPWYGALVSNCDLPPRLARGLTIWPPPPAGHLAKARPALDPPAFLHVSAGLGTSPYAPLRFACRPEATLLTLTS